MDRKSFFQPPTQGKEIKPEIDFVEIFRGKLAGIEVISEHLRGYFQEDLEKLGIKDKKRMCAGVVFEIGVIDDYITRYAGTQFNPDKESKRLELWIEDIESAKMFEKFRHHDVESELEYFLEEHSMPITKIRPTPFYLIQDSDDKIYIILEKIGRSIDEQTEKETVVRSLWLDLQKKYGIEKIFREPEKGVKEDAYADVDLVGKLREYNYLLAIIKKYDLNDLQSLKLRTLIQRNHDLKRSINYDTLANQIAKQEKLS